MTNDTKTTMLGAILGGLLAANVDYAKLLDGDPQAAGQLVGAAIAGLLGFYTNKVEKK